MGTSNIFDGNNDRNPLLPDDYQPESQTGSNNLWKVAKTSMSKYVSSGGTRGTAKGILRDYIMAGGGARQMMSATASGLHSARNIGSFFSGVAQNGILPTLSELGIQFEGKSIHEVFSQLINLMAPNSETKEDITARIATQAALRDLYVYIEQNSLKLDALKHIPQDIIDKALKSFFTEYIWANFMKDMESRIEQYMENTDSAFDREKELKGTIKAVVDVEYRKHTELFGKSIDDAVRHLMEKSLMNVNPLPIEKSSRFIQEKQNRM